jgi:hypothetical protein
MLELGLGLRSPLKGRYLIFERWVFLSLFVPIRVRVRVMLRLD